MKLIIDIPERDYKNVSRIVDMGFGTNVDEAIKNGTPLDDVKAEMLKYSSEHYVHDDNVWCYIGIIDKHIGKAESQKLADGVGLLNQSLEDAIDCS